MENTKGSIKTLAEFFVSEYHKNYHFNFEKSVIRLEFSDSFLLKIFNSNHEISKVYLISPLQRLFAETSQPFNDKIIKYFEDIETNPSNNYWIGYVEVDENFLPSRNQRFQIPKNN